MAATARCVLSFDPQGGIKRESDQLSRVPKPAGTDVLTGEGFGQAGPREPCTREDMVGRGGANLQMPPQAVSLGGRPQIPLKPSDIPYHSAHGLRIRVLVQGGKGGSRHQGGKTVRGQAARVAVSGRPQAPPVRTPPGTTSFLAGMPHGELRFLTSRVKAWAQRRSLFPSGSAPTLHHPLALGDRRRATHTWRRQGPQRGRGRVCRREGSDRPAGKRIKD